MQMVVKAVVMESEPGYLLLPVPHMKVKRVRINICYN